MGGISFNGLSEAEGRAAIVAEARAWLGTPYHPGGRIKGVGCDCGTLIAEVYERAGVIPHMVIPPYPPDWHKHRKAEKYLEFILQHGHPVEAPEPGDVAMWKFGLTRSHGAIVTAWPNVIHATFRERTVWPSNVAEDVRYNDQQPIFFSLW